MMLHVSFDETVLFVRGWIPALIEGKGSSGVVVIVAPFCLGKNQHGPCIKGVMDAYKVISELLPRDIG